MVPGANDLHLVVSLFGLKLLLESRTEEHNRKEKDNKPTKKEKTYMKACGTKLRREILIWITRS